MVGAAPPAHGREVSTSPAAGFGLAARPATVRRHGPSWPASCDPAGSRCRLALPDGALPQAAPTLPQTATRCTLRLRRPRPHGHRTDRATPAAPARVAGRIWPVPTSPV